jgi:O-methyltransferase
MRPDVRPLLRRLLSARRDKGRQYVFESDGLATVHFSPFLEDAQFNSVYAELRREWFPNADVDLRWRLWVLTQVARNCSGLEGNFAEFGVYRAGCAFMIFGTSAFSDSKRFFLYDTFSGIPVNELNDAERAFGLGGAHGDTSVGYVRARLAPWSDRIVLVPGDVNETLASKDPGRLAFVHMDLNAAQPTRVALEYAFQRLTRGGIILFDDYGQRGLEAQRDVIDTFLKDKPEEPLALPTSQALLVKQ